MYKPTYPVWDAYKGIWRYAQRIDLSKDGITFPKQIPPAPTRAYEPAIQRIDESLLRCQKEVILTFSPQYVAYLFLFCQWLRISYAQKPAFLGPGKGWANLRWLPLWSLAAENLDRYWYAFAASHRDDFRRGEAVVQEIFPWVPTDEELIVPTVLRHAGILRQRALETGSRLIDIVLTTNPLNIAPHNTVCLEDWHPWILLTLPAFWSYPGKEAPVSKAKFAINEFENMLYEPALFKLFCTIAFPAVWDTDPLLPQIKKLVLEHMDNLVRWQFPSQAKRWRRIRRQLLPAVGKGKIWRGGRTKLSI